MQVLSHRGWWSSAAERNTAAAFGRSFDAGFGTETDVRDCLGQLVISHDPAPGDAMTLDALLAMPGVLDLPLAVNVKSDGLAEPLKRTFARHPQADWFVFDMSVPDMRMHLRLGNPVFARMSEVERQPPWFDQVAGIWLDSFDGDWFDRQLIEDLLARRKRVCIVSAELHGRDPDRQWDLLRAVAALPGLMLCTDRPGAAQDFFSREPQ